MPMIATFFEQLPQKVGGANAKELNCVVLFEITGEGGGSWTMLLKEGNAAVARGNTEQADVTVTMSAQDFTSFTEGKLSGQAAFLMGKLKVKGDMGLAMQLPSVLGLA